MNTPSPYKCISMLIRGINVVLRYSLSMNSCSKQIGIEGVFEGFQLLNQITYLILDMSMQFILEFQTC